MISRTKLYIFRIAVKIKIHMWQRSRFYFFFFILHAALIKYFIYYRICVQLRRRYSYMCATHHQSWTIKECFVRYDTAALIQKNIYFSPFLCFMCGTNKTYYGLQQKLTQKERMNKWKKMFFLYVFFFCSNPFKSALARCRIVQLIHLQ